MFRNLARTSIPWEHLKDFDIQKLRGRKNLPFSEYALTPVVRCLRPQKNLQQDGSVDNDHSSSRSARRAFDGGMRVLTGLREASVSSNSSTVGRSADPRSSSKRKSESDLPAIAARVFSLRC